MRVEFVRPQHALLRWLGAWTLFAPVLLPGCGSDVVVPGPAPLAQADAAAADGATADAAPVDTPTCFVDSDCAALVRHGCEVAACEPTSQRCVLKPRLDGAACDDGEPCTAEAACAGGVCVQRSAVSCDDGNPCTTDSCEPGSGCAHQANDAAACDDGLPCTADERCVAGACRAATNLCGCTADADCAELGQNACLGQLVCVDGGCVAQLDTAIDCDDGEPCTADVCDPPTGTCSHLALPGGVTCVDGDVCTASDHCLQGTCVGTAIACADPSGCTAACEPAVGCTPTDAGPCDDGNGCTQGDHCSAAGCVGAPAEATACGCAEDSDCTGPLQACAGAWRCIAHVCVVDAALAVPCAFDSSDPCKEAVCTASGCTVRSKTEGSDCDDGSSCSVTTTCQSGQCQGGWASPCNDDNACTVDSCAPTGCVHTPALDGSACDDGSGCHSNQLCTAGVCGGGSALCEDSNPCTTDICSGAHCAHFALALGSPCDDSDPCTSGGECAAGATCVPQLLVDCNDNSPCTLDSCDDGSCVHLPVEATQNVNCNDGNGCTSGDTCGAGGVCAGVIDTTVCACQTNADCVDDDDGDPCTGVLVCVDHQCELDPSSVPVCTDADGPCFAVGCQPGTGDCVAVPLAAGVTCSDGNACTVGDACGAGGVCAPGLPVASCADDNPCNAEACDPSAGCTATALSDVPCDDGNLCTGVDTCKAGVCVPGTFVCQCQVDVDCLALDDGNVCNGGLVCDQGACVPDGLSVTCPPSNGACTESACDPQSGSCVAVARADGLACSPAGQCTQGGSCVSGQCVGATVVSCDDGNVCTAEACNPNTGACDSSPTTGTCDDSDPCAPGQCADGSCVTQPLVCNDGKSCTADSCVGGQGGCVFAGPTATTEGFETDAPTGWQYLTGSGLNFWQRDPAVAHSGGSALFCGDFDSGTGAPLYSGPGAATATGVYTVPDTATIAHLSLWTWVSRDAAEPADSCGDRLVVNASGTAPVAVGSICVRQSGWTELTADIPVAPGGSLTVALQWIVNDVANAGEGVWVDDLSLSWDCAVAP